MKSHLLTRRFTCWLCVASMLALVLTACPRTAPEQVATQSSTQAASTQPAGSPSPDKQQNAAATQADPASDAKRPPKMRTGGPLPPRRMPSPVELDRSCSTNADCTVKDVGNCCGRYPACVNVDSPADPAAVRAECARRGESSACGFREISACQCVKGNCKAQVPAIDPPVDPAPRVPETR